MNRPKAACDVDQVLADFQGPYYAYLNAGGDKSQFWQDARTKPDIWLSLKPICDFMRFQWIFRNYDVYFVTNCPQVDARREWLQRHGFMQPWNTLICNDIGKSKAEIIQILRPEVFVDDYYKNIFDIAHLKIVKHIFKFNPETKESRETSWQVIEHKIN